MRNNLILIHSIQNRLCETELIYHVRIGFCDTELTSVRQDEILLNIIGFCDSQLNFEAQN